MNSLDSKIIDRVYNWNHQNLKGKALWALGIVTGDNRKFISTNNTIDREPIYRGRDVNKFVLNKPSYYIKFEPENFQQVAPIKYYRANQKLIYRFISSKLIFAYDDSKSLTLNSANIVIPKIQNYPIKVIAAIFNSSLYQFLFWKKFSSIKVLRNHIEDLPLPLWNESTLMELVNLIDCVIEGSVTFDLLNDFILDKFALSKNEILYLKNSLSK